MLPASAVQSRRVAVEAICRASTVAVKPSRVDRAASILSSGSAATVAAHRGPARRGLLSGCAGRRVAGSSSRPGGDDGSESRAPATASSRPARGGLGDALSRPLAASRRSEGQSVEASRDFGTARVGSVRPLPASRGLRSSLGAAASPLCRVLVLGGLERTLPRSCRPRALSSRSGDVKRERQPRGLSGHGCQVGAATTLATAYARPLCRLRRQRVSRCGHIGNHRARVPTVGTGRRCGLRGEAIGSLVEAIRVVVGGVAGRPSLPCGRSLALLSRRVRQAGQVKRGNAAGTDEAIPSLLGDDSPAVEQRGSGLAASLAAPGDRCPSLHRRLSSRR